MKACKCVAVQLHPFLTSALCGENPRYILNKSGWAPEPVWGVLEKNKVSRPCLESNHDSSFLRPIVQSVYWARYPVTWRCEMHTQFWRGNHTATKLGDWGYARWIELAQRRCQWRHFVRAVYNRGVLLPQNSVCRVSGQHRTVLHDSPKHRFAGSAGGSASLLSFLSRICVVSLQCLIRQIRLEGLGRKLKWQRPLLLPLGSDFLSN